MVGHYLNFHGFKYTNISAKNVGYDLLYCKDGVEHYAKIIAYAFAVEGVCLNDIEYEVAKMNGDRYKLFVLNNLFKKDGRHYGEKSIVSNPVKCLNFNYSSSSNVYCANIYDIMRASDSTGSHEWE